MTETDKEMGQHKSVNVQLKRDSRIWQDANARRSIIYADEGIPEDSAVENPGFDMKTFNQQEGDNKIPQEQSHNFYENSIYPLEEVVDNMSPCNPEREGLVQTQDSSNNTDFENDNNNPLSDPENEKDGSQERDQGDANQGQDKNQDRPSSDDEAVDDENFTDDGNQGNNKPEEESGDPENLSSEPKDEEDQVEDDEEDQAEDKEAVDKDDIKDDEKMVDPPIIEAETDLDPDDPRKSIVHEALLAVQVDDPGSVKRKPEMEL